MDLKALNRIDPTDYKWGYELNGIDLAQQPLATFP